jgi:hypothetical protein
MTSERRHRLCGTMPNAARAALARLPRNTSEATNTARCGWCVVVSLFGCPSERDLETPSTGGFSGSGDTASTGELARPILCQPKCSTAVDCCGPLDELPPGVTCPGPYPYNYVCDAGFCAGLAPCTSDDECQTQSPDGICVEVDRAARCVKSCGSDADCFATLVCSGSSAGRSYCESSSTEDPFGCETDDQCEASGWGRCIDGRCGCTSDADCPADAGCPEQ